MIKQPEQITAAGKNFSMIIYAPPGAGKTTLALSADNPILCDFDNGVLRVRAEHRRATDVIANYDEFLTDLQSPEMASYDTIIIDTGGSMLTLMADWVKRKDPQKYVQRDGALQLKGYGVMKSEFQRLVSHIRDVMRKNVIFVFHSVEERDGDDTVMRLQAEGAAKNLVWQPCDFGGYIDEVGGAKVIDFTPTKRHFGKGCHGIHGQWTIPTLAPGAKNDFVSRLFAQARANIEAENAENQALQATYSAVMEQGMKILSGVTDAATANTAREELPRLAHVSTSKKELGALLAKRTKELGLMLDKELGMYIVANVDGAA